MGQKKRNNLLFPREGHNQGKHQVAVGHHMVVDLHKVAGNLPKKAIFYFFYCIFLSYKPWGITLSVPNIVISRYICYLFYYLPHKKIVTLC